MERTQKILQKIDENRKKQASLFNEGKRIIESDSDDKVERLKRCIDHYRVLRYEEEFLEYCYMYDDVMKDMNEVFIDDRRDESTDEPTDERAE